MSRGVSGSGVAVGEAPGRLDVLGGVADYSGSLVLQTPLAATTQVRISALDEPVLRLTSVHAGEARSVVVQAPEWAAVKTAADPASVGRAWLDAQGVPAWARYPLGCLTLYAHRAAWQPTGGLMFDVTSDVPVSMGVSSSAALEVATLRALEQWAGFHFSDTELARLAQRAENEIVGAPCGLMDQLASAHGQPGMLLPIRCRPDLVGGLLPLPSGVVVAGWPSGVAHAVSGSPYRTARTAAFMAKQILAANLGTPLAYLTDVSPSAVNDTSHDVLPDAMPGRAFLERHGNVEDPLSSIEAGLTYPVRAAAAFATCENARAAVATEFLGRGADSADITRDVSRKLGELLFESHQGYSDIGLGTPETDAMVAAVQSLGPEAGFYGARVSGGGSGGTVVVLLDEAALPRLGQLAADSTGTALIR